MNKIYNEQFQLINNFLKPEPDFLWNYEGLIKPGKLVAHYTSMSNFYSIIATDELWATQARFSNDDNELTHAKNLINEVISEYSDSNTINNIINDIILPDCYIISLCSDDDLLSQWRGYCGYREGVSISFDFSTRRPFYLVADSNISGNFYTRAQPVLYEDAKASLISIRNKGNIESDIIPFVKHPKFNEEKEYRLSVMNKKGIFKPFIKYRASNILHIPFVRIKVGKNDSNRYKCRIRLNIDEKYINNFSSIDVYKRRIVKCRNNSKIYDDKQCFGCSMRRQPVINTDPDYQSYDFCGYGEKYAAISTNENVISISEGNDQREVFNTVSEIADRINDELGANIKIWCEGHLPIRQIRVGNTRRLIELQEGLKHLCENSEYYWLKYVSVEKSEIPFRSPIEFK